MADILLPPWLSIASLNTQYRDNTGLTKALYTGAPETTGFGGDRLRFSLEFTPTGSAQSVAERSALRAFLARLRGRQNRAYLWDPSYRQRGSFPNSELLSNPSFQAGATGWGCGAEYALSVSDRVARGVRTAMTTSGFAINLSNDVTVTQYAPYVARFMVLQGRGSYPNGFRINDLSSGTVGADQSGFGMKSQAFVPLGTSLRPGLTDRESTGLLAGDHVLVPYASVSRCALVDNAANRFTQSDAIDHADWQKINISAVNANAFTAPDGTLRGDRIREDTSTGGHSVHQDESKSSAAEDWCIAGEFRIGDQADARTRVALRIGDTSATDFCQAIFDLSAGTVINATNAGTAVNARAVIRALGNGWYECALVGRTDIETTVRGRVLLVQGTGTTVSYTGVTTGDLGVGRMAFAQSGVPIRLGVTTTATLPTGTVQAGNGLHVKGLPASTAGLLRIDDRFEVITDRGSEIKIVVAALDSDASGLGYVRFEPPLMGTPADNSPIIFCNPMTRAIFAGELVGWDDNPGIVTTASAEFEEA